MYSLCFVVSNEKRHSNGPASCNARVKRRLTPPVTPHRLSHRHHLSVDFNLPCTPSVSGLGVGSGPSDIIWRVATVVVDAIKRHAWRASAYVCNEVVKAVAPSITNGNASTTVVAEVSVFRIQASLLKSAPCVVFMRLFDQRPGVPMSRWVHFLSGLFVQASATVLIASQQIGAANNHLLSALANAYPSEWCEVVK